METIEEYNITFKEFCQTLSISEATGKNWIRLGKINDYQKKDKSFLFKKDTLNKLLTDIINGENTALKSRRNKKYVSGNKLYNEYLSKTSKNFEPIKNLEEIVKQEINDIDDKYIYTILTDCALKLIVQRLNLKIKSSSLLKDYLKKRFELEGYEDLISEFSSKFDKNLADKDWLKNVQYFYEDNEDILGFLYISLSNIKTRKSKGVYYTPVKTVEKICKGFQNNNGIVLDPCCGTGNFLLKLDAEPDTIYGYDIDKLAVTIAKLNLALKYKISNKNFWDSHIKTCDFLNQKEKINPDYIVGNPPWGYNFSETEKQNFRKKYKVGKNIESFDLVLQQSIFDLNNNGVITFVLPEAFLNVNTHKSTREIISSCCNIEYIEYLGDIFDGVQCPSIIIKLKKTGKPLCTKGLKIKDKTGKIFIIKTNRPVINSEFSFNMTDEEASLIQQMENIKNKITLKGCSKFALGIVTGDNKKYLSSIKTDENEAILRGTDINNFIYNPQKYIKFNPKNFQQVAPLELYRAKEKLVYKFISKEPVFAYDNKQTLTLNSCNILIPEIEGIDIKYIMAVLNSDIVRFYYKKRFNSLKILRSHLENIPIPYPDKITQTKIVSITDKILISKGLNCEGLEQKLNKIISKLYMDINH